MLEKGLSVFLDYDQAELDAAYDQAAYAPNREQLIKRRIRDSELARAATSGSWSRRHKHDIHVDEVDISSVRDTILSALARLA
jgi:hypothetical protein